MQSLKNIRAQLGLSQIQFSGLLGISSGLISLAETGNNCQAGNGHDTFIGVVSTKKGEAHKPIKNLE